MRGKFGLIRLLVLILLVTGPACSSRQGDTAASTPHALSIQEKAWAEVRAGALLVDVRTPEEFSQGHLEGALLIPHDEIAGRASELGSDKDRSIVLYCRSGNRSAQAKQALEKLGYTHVVNGGGYESLKLAR